MEKGEQVKAIQVHHLASHSRARSRDR